MNAMSYIAFARKYRPQTFDDIIGQPHITTTLKNAILKDRVSHAYLFSGPRGVGKTTTARILAKAINCQNGPSPTPCNSCPFCMEITQGSSLDILEIDGASNRGIDEIRNLRESIKFAPSKGRFKIYIIDEVHMLTPEAFNALLKTLEEPPSHVKFIFATTLPHKVPLTILSRCQRFDFRRIVSKEIFNSIKVITKNEKIDISDEALILIVRHSDGSMRDAQVVLDQIASFTPGRVEALDVTRMLGVAGDDVFFALSTSIKQKDAKEALMIIDRIAGEGKDLMQAVTGLIEHFRNIAIAKIGRDLDTLIDAPDDVIKRYVDEAGSFGIEEILYVIYALSNTIDFMRKTAMPRVPVEAAMVKLTRTGSVLRLDEVLDRIERLERGCDPQTIERRPPVTDHRPQTVPACQSDKSRIEQLPGQADREETPSAESERPEIESVDPEPLSEDAELRPDKPQGISLEEVLNSWAKVVDHIKSKKISVASYLDEGHPISLESNILSVGFPKECQFHKEVLESQENRRLIEDAINSVIGLDLKITLVTIDAQNVERPSRDTFNDDVRGDSFDNRSGPKKKDYDPIVKAALEIFNGEVAAERSGKKRPK